MFVIPAIIVVIIFLLLKILVPAILIVSLVILLCIYFRNRGQGEQQEPLNIDVNAVKEKATSAWDKLKFILNFFSNQKKESEGQELKEV